MGNHSGKREEQLSDKELDQLQKDVEMIDKSLEENPPKRIYDPKDYSYNLLGY